MDVSARLRDVAASSSASSRPQAYLAVLNDVLTQPASLLSATALLQVLSDYLDHAAFSDGSASGGNLVAGRQALSDFVAALAQAGQRYKQTSSSTGGDDHVMLDSTSQTQLPAIADEDVQRQAFELALEKVQPRALSFEEQTTSIRLHLADVLEDAGEWLEAARVLQGISLDSGHRSVSDLSKLRTYVRIVRLLLEGDDPVGADTALKRASLVIHHVPGALSSGLGASSTNATQQEAWAGMSDADRLEAKTLGLQYKLSQARIYDAQRRFADAANRYHEVSYVSEIDETERTMMLSAAVTASILAPAGPQRSRILATLVRDERTASLPQHTILTKTFLDQIIRPKEIALFEKLLSPHQLAILPHASDMEIPRSTHVREDAEMRDGEEEEEEEESARSGPSTVLDRAMMEHNIIAASRLYTNITFRGLGNLLDLNSSGAETMVRRMIVQGRLKAEIDQVAGLIVFGEQDARVEMGSSSGSGSTGSAAAAAAAAVSQKESEQAQHGQKQAETDDHSAMYTKRWDANIAKTASALEEVCARLRARGYAKVSVAQ